MSLMRLANATRTAMADAIRNGIDGGAGAGTIKVYSGVQPATGDTGLAGNTLLGTLTFTDPSAPGAVNGVTTFSAITEDTVASATGTATWARIQDSNGANVFDCDVSDNAGNGYMKLNTVNIVAGGPIRCSAGGITIPAQ